MSKYRYSKEITGICTICEYEGKTEIHHIISKAKIKRIKPNQHGADLDLIKNPGNLIELCLPCHELTDSHIYWKFHKLQDARAENKGRRGKKKSRRKSPKKTKVDRRGGLQCSHIYQSGARKGRRCGQKNRKIKEGGFCYSHSKNSSIIEVKDPPGLHDEGWLDDEELAALEMMMFLQPEDIGENELQFFTDKSLAWRKRWLPKEVAEVLN